jgi:hypothetical protein
MTYKFWIDTSTIAATPSPLIILLPAGRAAQKKTTGFGFVDEAGTTVLVRLEVDPAVNSGTTIQITKVPIAVFANATDTTSVRGEITLEIT